MNRNLLSLMILMKLKKKMSKDGLKNKNVVRWVEVINCWEKTKKQEESKEKEKKMWERLGELSKEF